MGSVIFLSIKQKECDEGTDVDEVYLRADGTFIASSQTNGSEKGYEKAVMKKQNECDDSTDVDEVYWRKFGKTFIPKLPNIDEKEKSLSSYSSNNCTVFVGNISYRVTQRVLWDFFTAFGTVTKTCIVMDHIKYHRRSRGIGFVTFSSPEAAKGALMASEDELMLDNRLMRVFPADRKKRELQNINSVQQNKSEGFELEEQVEEVVVQVNDQIEAINLLPNDVLLYIFSFLGLKDKVCIERVCRRWQIVAIQSWQSLEKFDTNGIFGTFSDKMLTDDILRVLLKKGCWNLKAMDLSSSPHLLTDWSVELIGQRCKKLCKLDLSSVKVTKSSLKFLASSCSLLKWIRLRKCNGFGEKGLWWLFHYCKFLEYVDVSENYRVSGQCFYMLSDRLVELILAECSGLCDDGLSHLAFKCPRLQHLDLSGCVFITNSSIEHLCKELHNLEKLLLKGCYHKINPGSLNLSGLTSLKELAITHNDLLPDATIINVCKTNPALRCLNIEGAAESLSDIGLKAISNYCSNLKQLNISYINKVTAEALLSLSLLSNLREIKMKACTNLGDKELTSIAFGCANLEFVDVTGCTNITEESIKILVEVHNAEMTLKPDKFLRLNLGGTNVHNDYIKLINSTGVNICVSCHSTLLEQYTHPEDDSIILGGFHTDEEDLNDDQELEARNYGNLEADWNDHYHSDSHNYYDNFLEVDDPFAEYEEWDVS